MRLDIGDVVWHEVSFKPLEPDGSRPDQPWFIGSNDYHPFHGTEYIVLGMTTNPRAERLRVQHSDWTEGGISTTGFISPWFAITLKHADITHRIGAVHDSLVTKVIDELLSRLGPNQAPATTNTDTKYRYTVELCVRSTSYHQSLTRNTDLLKRPS